MGMRIKINTGNLKNKSLVKARVEVLLTRLFRQPFQKETSETRVEYHIVFH